jgi:predicted XRE-type DNA-binding protein
VQRKSGRKNEVKHVSRGSVLDDLGLDVEATLELRLKVEIHEGILRLIERRAYTPRQLERVLDIPQSRVSELLRGKLSLISVKRLLEYMDRVGGKAKLRVSDKRAA